MIDKGITFLSIYDKESYALRILSAILKREGFLSHQVYFKSLYTCNFPFSQKELLLLIELLKKLKTKILCVSLRSSSLKTFCSFYQTLKEQMPDIDILIGGTHATLFPFDALKYADAVCVGDAEETIVEVAKKYDQGIESLTLIKGVWVKDSNGKIIESPFRGAFENLDSLPIEIYEDDNKYFIEDDMLYEGEPLIESSTMEVFASRGCPRVCTFCSNSKLKEVILLGHQKYVRIRGVQSVIKELKYIKQRFKKLKRIVFADEVFGLNKEWVQEFSKVYPEEIRLPFSALFYVTLIKEDIVLRLKEAGLSHSRVGIQSGSERIRKDLYQRNESDSQIIRAGKLFNKLNIRFTYDLIVNNPYETEEDKLNGLRLLSRIPRPFELNLHSLVYFPNTVLTNKALSENIIKPQDVEGKDSCKALFLTDVLSRWKGNDVFWNSLFSLTSKDFIPRVVLMGIAESRFFKKREVLVLYLAKFATVIKMFQIGSKLVVKGQISFMDAWKMFLSVLRKPLTNK